MADKFLYTNALEEWAHARDESLWLKSMVESDGDEERAKLLYIKLRVEEMAAQGSNRPVDESAGPNFDLTLFAKQIQISIDDDLAPAIRTAFIQLVGAKKFDDVLCDISVSKDVVAVTPASKSYSGIAKFGAVLAGGGGALGYLGLEAGRAIGRAFANRNSAQLKAILSGVNNTLLMPVESIMLRAYDYRIAWDLAGGEWETRVSLKANGVFNDQEGKIHLVFTFPGKTYEKSFLGQANNKVPELARLLNIPVPEIKKETKFIW